MPFKLVKKAIKKALETSKFQGLLLVDDTGLEFEYLRFL